MLRRCPGDVTRGAEVVASYSGVAGEMLGQNDPVFGGYAYYAPYLIGDWADLSSWLYIQNAGLECSSVAIWFRRQAEAGRSATSCSRAAERRRSVMNVMPIWSRRARWV